MSSLAWTGCLSGECLLMFLMRLQFSGWVVQLVALDGEVCPVGKGLPAMGLGT